MIGRLFSRRFSSIKVQLPGSEVHRLDANLLPKEATSTREELLKYLKDIYTIRRIEIASDGLYKNGKIRGFCHLCDGQEAIPVGMEAALTYEDAVITAYRDHGIAYGRGDTAHGIIAEMMGKKTGSSKGKGGSMHYYEASTNFYGGNGIVGAQVPVGAGLAFALKYKGLPNVAVAMYGDGAANQGQIYEAANMAALWKLPAIFVCENNLYGMGTSVERASANRLFYTRGETIPGFTADGCNVLATREAFKFAKQWAIKNGPIFLELNTYRYHGHSMSDPGLSYRSRDEVNEVRDKRDPLVYLKSLLQKHNLAEEAELKAMEKKIKEEVEAAVKQSEEDPWPTAEDLFTDIYDPSEKVWNRNVEHGQSYVA
mmetsp:Transcript_13715/g.25864  ORF Transcript_13715/g.25864 Transcript_13715/m.25864 type:complete len:370 (-) Transcript_13715:1419-2528(-)